MFKAVIPDILIADYLTNSMCVIMRDSYDIMLSADVGCDPNPITFLATATGKEHTVMRGETVEVNDMYGVIWESHRVRMQWEDDGAPLCVISHSVYISAGERISSAEF